MSSSGERRGSGSARLLAVVFAIALCATACNGNDDDGAGDEGAGPPRAGGELVVGLDAEADGLDPATSQWSPATYQMGVALMDPLMAPSADGTLEPYLAESFEATNGDFTEFELRIRPGIQFHDGTPLDAEAVKLNVDRAIDSLLVGPVFRDLDEPEIVDDLTLRLTTSRPWATLPVFFAGQPGFIGAPSWLRSDSPDPQAPVGTGPFALESRTLDAQTVVARTDDYWREGFPYLDRITFRVVPDTEVRVQALETGELDISVSQRSQDVEALRDDADLESIENPASDENFVMLNVEQPPLDDERVRLALAHALDRDEWLELVGVPGITRLATSPWPPETPWHPEGLEFPEHDPDRARELLAQYEADTGQPVTIALATSPTPEAIRTQEVVAEQWEDVGVEVTIEQTEQATLITDVIGGNYQALVWRQFNAEDPDGDAIWWLSENADGPVALNFARNRDPAIDEALFAARATDDVEERKAQYRIVAERLLEDLPYLWLGHTNWIVAFQPSVEDVGTWDFPDGDPGIPLENSWFRVHQIWRSG